LLLKNKFGLFLSITDNYNKINTSRQYYSPDVTGGVYKAPKHSPWRADSRLLTIPASCRAKLQPTIRTKVIFIRLTPIFILVTFCKYHCNTWVAQPIRVMTTWPHPSITYKYITFNRITMIQSKKNIDVSI